MEQTQKLKKYDFEKALKSGYSKSQIVNSLRNNYDTNLDWEKINEDLKELNPKERDEVLFDSLYNNQEIWGISGIKTKEPPKGLQNRIPSDNQIQHIEKEVQNMPQWAIESALKPQILREAINVNVDGFWKIFQNKEEIARENALKNALDKGITQKLEKGESLSIGEILRYYNANDMKGHFTPQSHYKEQQELKKIAQTNFENLDESQKRMLQRQNKITRLWNSPKELHDNLKDEVAKRETDAHTKARAEQLERDVINIQRTHENLLTMGADYLKGSTEQRDKYREMLQESAISLGFDGIGFKGDRIYAFKGDKAIFIDDGFFKNLGQILGTNTFDIAGSITGAIAGAKRGTGKIGKLAGAIAGGAVGAGLGGIADSIIAQYNSRGEFNLADALLTGAESATFDIAGGLIVSGGAKAVKGAVKYPLKAAEFVVDRIPILSSVKNAAKNNNFQAVDNMINKNIGQEAREEISENLQEFGGQIHSENVAKYNAIKKTILEKYPDKAEGINKFFGYFETFAQESLKDKQNELLHLYRADRDGSLTAYLVEVANSSPKLQKNLRAMLNLTTSKIAAMVEDLNLSPRTNKEIFDALESNVKAEYAEVMERILPEIYDDSYKVTIDRMPFDKEIQRMLSDRLLQENDKLIVKSLADEIFQPNQTFKQLVNIKHRLNDQYKQISEGSRGYVEKSVDKLLREAIDSGVNAILGQNKTAFIKARNLYDTMNLEYGRMKEVIGIVDTLKLRDKATSFEKGFNKLYKYLNGQGEADISNLQRLTRYMSETDKEVFESALLKKMFDKAIYEKEKQGIKVFDSTLFLSRIKELSENGAVFESKGAKEFIDIVDKFHALFRQDAEIAKSLSNPKSKNGTGNGIATTLSGRIQQAMVNSLFSVFFRNIPESSLMAQMLTLGKGKDFIGGMALRYHTQKALERAISVDDFMTKFTHSIQHTQWSSASKKKIDDFLTSLREIQTLSEAEIKTQNQAQSMSDYTSENALEQLNALSQANTIKEFGENYPQFYHKGSEAIEHLLQTKSGQVQGAFYREDLGDITLVWGNEGTGKSDGYGLSKIAKYHPEVLEKLDDLVTNLPIIKETPNRYQLENENYKIAIRKDFEGESEKWILTAFEKKESIARRRTDLPSSQSEAKKTTLANTQNSIIPQSEPFASTKANFTKEQWQNLTTQEKIQILKDRRRQELQRAIQEKMAKEAQESQALKAAQQEKQRIKDAQVGKAINEVDLNLQEAIQARALKPTRINLENKSYSAQFVIINKEDLKPNFETKGTQGRTQKQDNVIQDIQNNLNPNKLFFSEGGFDGLPIILQDGSIAVGNHRAQALKNLSQESLAAYQKSAKEVFNVDLKDDELIVRMLDKDIPKQEILNLSFASNVGREQNLSEKALSTLGKYQEDLDKLPQNIYAQNVEEMQQIVAKSLDKTNNGLNTFDTNLALLSSLAKSKDKNILDALNAISGDAEQKAKVIKMFVENAGNFHNLAKQTQMPNLDLRDYLTQALYFTAKADKSRVENFKELAQEMKSIIQTTDAQGKNALIQEESRYNELIGKALGYSFARFRELENPSGSFFDFLSNIKLALSEELEPTLFSAGRPLSSADIYDFLSVSIKSGIPSNETSEVLELLPQLKAKHEAFKEANTNTQRNGNGNNRNSFNSNNGIINSSSADNHNKQISLENNEKNIKTQGITEEIKQLIDTGAQKGRDMQIIGQENFTPEVVEYVQQQNKKVAIEKLSQEEAEALGFKYPQDVRVTIDSSAINHTLNRHGAESNLAQKSGQKAVSYDDIAKYREYAKNADETLQSVDNGGSNVLVSYKQVNGHFVVVEQIKKKNNELGFKTLFKEQGNYKDSKSYKDTKAKAQTLSIGYEPSANSFTSAKSLNSNAIIPQSTKEAIDPANRFAEPFSNELFSALPKAKQAQYQSLQKQAGLLYDKYHQAKGIEAKRAYEKQYNAMLDKIYDFEQKYPVRVPSTQVQVRGNTMPTYKPDEIIDVEIIAQEPSIQKQITYKRHNLRAKAIQSLQVKLEALKPYPQKQIEYKKLESQINTLVEKQHKELQQPSLFSEEDLEKNRNNDFKQNQGEIQLEGRNREQGKANRQHTQKTDKKENELIKDFTNKLKAYEVKSPRLDSLPSGEVAKSDGTNLRSNDFDDKIISQNPKVRILHKRLEKKEAENAELYKTMLKFPALPPNQSNNARRARYKSLGLKKEQVLAEIQAIKEKIIEAEIEALQAGDKTTLGEVQEVFTLPNKEKQFKINNEWYHESALKVKADNFEKRITNLTNTQSNLQDIPFTDSKDKEQILSKESAVSLENEKILNKRIKEFADTIDEYHNPQNIEVKDIDSLVRFISAWSGKPLTTKGFLKEPLKYRFTLSPKNFPQFDELAQDISAWVNGLDLTLPQDLRWEVSALKSAKTDYSYIIKHKKLKNQDDELKKRIVRESIPIMQSFRTKIEQALNLHPTKEFGTNYAEYYRDGQGAIAKIIAEAKDYKARKTAGKLTPDELKQGAYKGQVAGAFYRKDLEELSGNGNIDVVWGEITDAQAHKGYGLVHILDKHKKEFKDIAKDLSEIVENGKLIKDDKGRLRIENENYIIGIKDNFKGKKDNNWIVTAYEKKEGGGSLYTSPHNHTSEIPLETSTDIIPQNAEQFYDLHHKITDLKSALKEASIDQDNNSQWLKKWGEDAHKAYLTHKELAQKHNNPPQSFKDFKAEFQDQLQKHTQAKMRNAAKIQSLQKQLEQTQKAFDDFQMQGYEKIDGYFLPLNYKDTSDFIAQIRDLGERNQYALFNTLKSQNFEAELLQFLEFFSKTHTKEQTQKIEQTLAEAKRFYDALKKKDLESFYNKAKRQTKSINNQQTQSNSQDIPFTDSKGKEQILSKATQEQLIGNSEQLLKAEKAQELQTLKQKLQNADKQTKREILLSCLQEDSKRITDEIMEAMRIAEEKDFLPHEIEEAKNRLSANIPPERKEAIAILHLTEKLKEKIPNLIKEKKQIVKEILYLEHLFSANDTLSLERLAKIEKRVLKSLDEDILENNLTYRVATTEGEARARELFESCKPDSEQRELFERILPIAQKLNVEIKQAINNKKLSKEADGVYYTGLNSVRVKNNRVTQEKGKVFLHELIHSVTSRAMIAYETGKKELLTPNQVAAIRNIKEIYSDTLKNHKDLGFELESKTKVGDYGLVSSHEFIAELSNPTFREKLKKVGVFEKIVDNILRLFVSAKEAFMLKKNNAYDTLKKNLYAIIDDYKEDFTAAYEMAKIKNTEILQGNRTTQAQIQAKFKFDKKKAKDLAEWHKDSSPLTKDEQGLPKVFYHGAKRGNAGREVLEPKYTQDSTNAYPAIFFSSNKSNAESYIDGAYLPSSEKSFYQVFINAKNPLVIDFKGKNFIDRSELANKIKEGERWFDLSIKKRLDEAKAQGKPYDSIIYKNVRDDKFGGGEIGDTIAVFNPNQIKAVENKGLKGESGEHKYFNAESPNIYQSNAHIGSGLVSGSVAGFETDEQGNLNFNPANFLLGLAGGAVGSKAIAQGFKAIHKNPELKAKVTKELADTLSKGWDSATKAYPILSTLEPRHIIAKSEKGRDLQARHILREAEKEEIYKLRESTKQTLHNIAGKNITNAHDGRIAQVSKKNISKMVSDKAIAKSVANGFSAMEHFNAVNDIESLYKNAIFKETTADKHGEIYLKIHRYNAQFENANALITLKETTEHGNKIYTLELEELEAPTKQVHSQAIGEQLSKSRKLEPMHPNTPLENSESIIPQTRFKQSLESKKAQRRAELESKIAKRGF